MDSLDGSRLFPDKLREAVCLLKKTLRSDLPL